MRHSMGFSLTLNVNCIFRPVFRSYKPADEDLKDQVLPEAGITEITEKVAEELENEDQGVVMESLVRKL